MNWRSESTSSVRHIRRTEGRSGGREHPLGKAKDSARTEMAHQPVAFANRLPDMIHDPFGDVPTESERPAPFPRAIDVKEVVAGQQRVVKTAEERSLP